MSFFVLELSEVSKTFMIGDRSIDVLRGISLGVKAGECVGIEGPSGAGKSTLLHIAGTLLRPTAGKVAIGDDRVDQASDAERSRLRNKEIGFVFQSHLLLPDLTAFENIELPLRMAGEFSAAQRRSKCDALLETVGLQHRARHVPGELSGGEQQRVAVARALVHGPHVVLADEPTGDLDREHGQVVFELLRTTCREWGAALVVATHDMDIARQCDRTLEMVDGKIQ